MSGAIFTSMRPDAVATVLKTGYQRYESKQGISGLCRIKGFHLDLLFVSASKPGTGQFRRFIAACKTKYDSITVWEIWNKELPAILTRYGFKPTGEVPEDEEPDARMIEGYRWER